MLCFKLIKKNYIESSSWFGDVKSLLTGSTTWRWELIWPQKWSIIDMGLTTDAHPHNPLSMRHNYSHAYIHTTNKGCTQTYTYRQTLHILTHMFTHITFIMLILNFRINIILYMWWRFSIDIMLTITFIV